MASALCEEILTDAVRGDSEQYDLAGFTQPWLNDLVEGCLGRVIPAKTYVACKFVIGGGKKTRQKYDPEMLKHFTVALSAAGLEEDRGASACAECQGMYKYQHDTDKDLKYLHVFPKVDLSAAAEDAEDGGGGSGGGGPQSPEYQCVSCTYEEFQELLAMNVPSFSQKRALLKRMRVMESALEQLESMLTQQQRFTSQEQDMYDSMVDVGIKVEFLNKELEKMVTKGRLTKGEQKQMVSDLGTKMEELDVAIATADAEGKAKKKDALEGKKSQLTEKTDVIAAFKPIVYTMAHEKELNDLRKELAVLDKIDTSGKLLKGDDLTKLAKKPRVEERIAALESEDKGWFEDECRAVLFNPAAAKPAPKKKTTSGGGGGGGSTGWLTTAAKGSSRSGPATKKAAPQNPFALLGGDE
uniref:Uncharacterized protein n=1 Tax=Mantoniella antarctica TaxID=81844 RepID=A0A7S0S9Q3_9CHLO